MSTAKLTRDERKRQTRDALVEAATSLFARNGIAATSIDQIAAEVGLTKGAVYAHFASKEALVEAVLWHVDTSNDLGTHRALLFDETKTLQERMRDFARSFVRLLRSPHMRDLVLIEMETSLTAIRSGDAGGLIKRERRDFKTYGGLLDEIAERRGEPMPVPGFTWMFLMQLTAKGLAYQRMRDPKSLPDDAVEAMLMTLVTLG